MLQKKTQEKMTEKKCGKEGKMPKNSSLSVVEKRAAWARAVDKYRTGQGQREESGGGVTLKGLWLVEETMLDQLTNKEHEDKSNCYTPTPVSCLIHCLTKRPEHNAQQMDYRHERGEQS